MLGPVTLSCQKVSIDEKGVADVKSSSFYKSGTFVDNEATFPLGAAGLPKAAEKCGFIPAGTISSDQI